MKNFPPPGLLTRALLTLSALLLGACALSPTPDTRPTTPPPQLALTPSPTPTAIPPPPPTQTPTSPAPSATPTPVMRLCSPLQGIPLADLPQVIVNPFHPPPDGSDDPHQGVDFAHLDPGGQIAVQGLPVQAVLAGQVAALILDRFPYGNAIMIETPLQDLPPAWLLSLETPLPTSTPGAVSALTCPDLGDETHYDLGNRSLYLLYAHLKEPVTLGQGESIACGETLGAIGSTGNAINPHLHLETRLGPSGARFASLAHYHASATLEEMSNYCTWRVSGLFPLVDPMMLLSLAP